MGERLSPRPPGDALDAPNKAPPSRGAARRRRIVFDCLVVLASIGLVEGAARIVEIWRPPHALDIGAGFTADSRVFVPSATTPGLFETDVAKRLYFQTQSFRMPKPPGTLRVAVLGGSSVKNFQDEFRVLESDLLAALPGRCDRVEVINAGGLSYGSGRLVGVASEMLGYEPDVVVLYEANNEFEELRQLHLASLDTLTAQRTLSHSAAVRVLRDFLMDRKLAEMRREIEEEHRRVGAMPGDPDGFVAYQYDFKPEDIKTRMAAFQENYALIISLCRRQGVPIVLGSVPSNLVRPDLIPRELAQYQSVTALLAAGKYDEALALGRRLLALAVGRHQSSDLENSIIRGLADAEHVPLADVEAAVVAAEPHHVPGETLFSDHCHLNARGSRIWRKTVERAILDALAPR